MRLQTMPIKLLERYPLRGCSTGRISERGQVLKMANPLVAIIMGSESDMPVMNEATKILDRFDVMYKIIGALAPVIRGPHPLRPAPPGPGDPAQGIAGAGGA